MNRFKKPECWKLKGRIIERTYIKLSNSLKNLKSKPIVWILKTKEKFKIYKNKKLIFLLKAIKSDKILKFYKERLTISLNTNNNTKNNKKLFPINHNKLINQHLKMLT